MGSKLAKMILLYLYGSIFVNPEDTKVDQFINHQFLGASKFMKNSTFLKNLRRLEMYLSTNNVTEVFLQRDDFCDEINDILKIPKKSLRAEGSRVTQTVKMLDEFSTRIGDYLHRSSISSTNIPRSEFAWAASLQRNQSVRISKTQANKNLFINIDRSDTNEIDTVDDLNISCSAFLPRQLFISATDKVVHATVYRDSILYVDKESSTIASSVLSVALDDFTPKTLASPVKLLFRKSDHYTTGTFSCVYFEFGEGEAKGNWKSTGCQKTNETKAFVYCECNHLTNFALLLDVSQTGLNMMFLKIVTWIGCSFSLVGLIITICIYSLTNGMRNRLGSRIIVCLCVSLTLLIIVFLTFAENRSGMVDDVRCMVASVFIQYFLLVTFMWMGTEAMSIYLLVVKPMEKFDQSLFFKKCSASAFTAPAIIVIITGVVEPENLLSEDLCLVRGLSFYIGVLAPIILILLFNMIVIVCSFKSLSRPSLASKQISSRQQWKITVSMSVLLGGMWLFALFAVGKATLPFQVIFTVLTSLQGFFVFVLFVLLEKETREVLFYWCTQQHCSVWFRCSKVEYSREKKRLKRNTLTTSVDYQHGHIPAKYPGAL